MDWHLTHYRDVLELTDQQRLEEVTDLLATGIKRLHSQKKASSNVSETPLDFSGISSVHVSRAHRSHSVTAHSIL